MLNKFPNCTYNGFSVMLRLRALQEEENLHVIFDEVQSFWHLIKLMRPDSW